MVYYRTIGKESFLWNHSPPLLACRPLSQYWSPVLISSPWAMRLQALWPLQLMTLGFTLWKSFPSFSLPPPYPRFQTIIFSPSLGIYHSVSILFIICWDLSEQGLSLPPADFKAIYVSWIYIYVYFFHNMYLLSHPA